jgi:hypothetical protein
MLEKRIKMSRHQNSRSRQSTSSGAEQKKFRATPARRTVLVALLLALAAVAGGVGIVVFSQSHNSPFPGNRTQGDAGSQSTISSGPTFSVAFSGAVSGPLAITTVNSCGPDQNAPSYIVDAIGTINGAPYEFTIEIPTYRGPGTYSTVGAAATAAISLTNTAQAHTWSSAADQAGSVTVQGDGQAGMISVTLTDDQGQKVQVTGTWSCG